MNQDINLVIENFKQTIFNAANQSGLPISVVYYVLSDTFREVESEYNAYINAAREREAATARNMQETAMPQAEETVPAEEMTEIVEDN